MDQRMRNHVCAKEQPFSPSENVAENIPLQSFRIAYSTAFDSEVIRDEVRQEKQKELEDDLKKKEEQLKERNEKVNSLKGRIDNLKNQYRFSQQKMF